MMEPLVANPAATKPVLHRKFLRLGAFAFIGFLPDEARSPIRIDVAMIERPVQILGPASSNLKTKSVPRANRDARIRQQSLEEFALSLHPEKTRLIEFGRHAADRRASAGLGKPETFKFLGFAFISGKSRRGQFLVHRKSRRDRMQVKLKEVKKELRKGMHQPIPEQGRWLAQVVRGYFAYHAVPTNRASISAFRRYVIRLWHRMHRRRSQKDRFPWERMPRLADDWLPQPHNFHPWPHVRFAVKYSR
jgi:RNA-directed DNA polymerase